MTQDGTEFAIVYTDGGARPTNPGFAGFGVVVEFPNSEREDSELSRFLGRKRTNNEAEFLGAFVGIGYAYFLGARSIQLRCDSKLVVESLAGNFHIRQPKIKDLARDLSDRMESYYNDNWDVMHIPRKENARADLLATEAIYWGMGQNPWTPKLKRAGYLAHGRVVDPFRLGPLWA